MLVLYFVSCCFLVPRPGAARESALPSWLADDPAFSHPKEVDSTRSGSGFISAAGKANLTWLVACNDKTGHGIQVDFTVVSLDPDSEEFLAIAPRPSAATFNQIKLFTGRFRNPPRQLRIPNTKSFQVFYSAAGRSAQMALKYNRYGTSLEPLPPPTDNPLDNKETLFEIQLGGVPPTEYLLPDFSSRFKTALRSIARRYANVHHIPFDESIPTDQMVTLLRVSFCPIEWPQRDTCASIQHSLFVSGLRAPDGGSIKDYQLTADHLKTMWTDQHFPELTQLGLTVFLLPPTSDTVLTWSLFIVLMAAFSLVGSFFFWRSNHVGETRWRSSAGRGAKKARRAKPRSGRQERMPSFVQAQGEPATFGRGAKEELHLRERFEDVSRARDWTRLPIENYSATNPAFEDDEEGSLELRSTSLVK